MQRLLKIPAALAFAAVCATVLASASHRDLGREVLEPGDGWASVGEGVTGGAAASEDYVFVVRNRAEFAAAITAAPAGTPRIIYVDGTIDANVDADNSPLACEDYYRNGYTLEGFLAFYDPAGEWGPNPPANTAGSLEAARRASASAQSARIRFRVPDNTTIVGVDRRARIRGAWLDLRGSSSSRRRNIIIRNIAFEDVYDCFPAWTPGRNADGTWTGSGAWDSEYDAISLRETERVWIDHNDFRDVDTIDSGLPVIFGAKYQIHDGLVDVTNASDRVTVSWNRFSDHDKTMLIGSSDSATADTGRLRVTLHHNLFENVGQRAPRVRFGQVHVYNNVYKVSADTNYQSSWGAGLESQIYAENNYFEMSQSFGPMEVIDGKKGTRLSAVGNCWTEKAGCEVLDLVAEWNKNFDPDLAVDAGWRPTLYGGAKGADIPAEAREKVLARSGPGKL